MRRELMSKLRCVAMVAALCCLSSASASCGGGEEAGETPSRGEAPSETVVTPGEDAWLHLQADSMVPGTAIVIRRADGTKEPALFFGPRRLAEQLTSGTFEFAPDSLPTRVRLLGPGDKLRTRED